MRLQDAQGVQPDRAESPGPPPPGLLSTNVMCVVHKEEVVMVLWQVKFRCLYWSQLRVVLFAYRHELKIG
jgi:hypothetical protein